MHDSSARDPPPRCAEGTRRKVIADILTWIKDPNPKQSLVWLNGPFGNGKSAVMQTIAESLRKDPRMNYLAGSFFFGRGKAGRDKAKYLIPTIAYQIAINIPWMRKPIESALNLDPTILSKSIEAQLRYLITMPLQHALNESSRSLAEPFHTPTVMIDGLDECEGHDFQCRILSAISTAIFEDHAQLRFLIASRPERQISSTFRAHPLHEQYLAFTLVDDYETYEELKQHLGLGFNRIYERHDLMYSVKKPWPSHEEMEKLARRASGQFLYASTVLRFVDSDDAHPVDQLKLILTRQVSVAFSNMDELYSVILESCPCQEALPSILRSLVLLRGFLGTQAAFATISGLRTEDVAVVLRRLPAIIAVERPDQTLSDVQWQQLMRFYSPVVSVHHQSFIEFLTDKKRAGRFFVDEDIAYKEMIAHLDTLVTGCLTQSEPPILSIYPCTWGLISGILDEDLDADRVQPPLLHWRRLRMFFDDLKEHRDPLPSKLSGHFFNSLSSVLAVIGEKAVSRDFVALEDYVVVSKRIFEKTYFDSFLMFSTPTVWKIIGVVSLGDIYPDIDVMEIDKVSQRTGLSVPTILDTLEENLPLFNVTPSLGEDSHKILLHIGVKPVIRDFLLDKSHSRDLFVAYRTSILVEFRSELIRELDSSNSSFLRLDKIFAPFLRYEQRNIQIDIDMLGASPMLDVIGLLHVYMTQHGDLARRACIDWEIDDGSELFEWLCTQLHILNATSSHEATASKLWDIISIIKDRFIRLLFDTLRRFHRKDNTGCNLPPFGTEVNTFKGQSLEYKSFLSICQRMWRYYSAISILWNRMGFGLSSENHAAIVQYWISVLLSAMVGRSFVANNDHDALFAMAGDIQWDSHLSQIASDEEICNSILTIHYLFVKRPDLLCGNVPEVMELLPLSFLKASLIRWRQHYDLGIKGEHKEYQNCSAQKSEEDAEYQYNQEDYSDDHKEHQDKYYQGEGFESWCEQAITLKARIAMASPAFSTFPNRLFHAFLPTYSNVEVPSSRRNCTRKDSLGVD